LDHAHFAIRKSLKSGDQKGKRLKMIINPSKFDFWIEKGLNVLFIGEHGVGKTSLVKEAFERHGLRWMYFSASTMDPWVDLIGVPKEKKDDNGGSYLELVRPKEFQDDKVEAIFFDEFNRSHSKVRNAVMELIQFHSINGHKFNNLRVIWAAINPEGKNEDGDERYDVERLDPAQKDRFHVHVFIPFRPDANFFKEKFGIAVSKPALEWWDKLPPEAKEGVSPRRLDYALSIYVAGGDIKDVVPWAANPSSLLSCLQEGSIVDRITDLFGKKDAARATDLLKQPNFYRTAISYILKNLVWFEWFGPLMPEERQAALLKNTKARRLMIEKYSSFKEVIDKVIVAGGNNAVVRDLKNAIPSDFPSFLKSCLDVCKAINEGKIRTNKTYHRRKLLRSMIFPVRSLSKEEIDLVIELCMETARTVQGRFTLRRVTVEAKEISRLLVRAALERYPNNAINVSQPQATALLKKLLDHSKHKDMIDKVVNNLNLDCFSDQWKKRKEMEKNA